MFFESKDSQQALMNVVRMVSSMKEGDSLSIDRHVMRDIQGHNYNGADFTSADRVLGNIVGSAYEFSFTTDPSTGATIFHRHTKKDGKRYYTDPDRRHTAIDAGQEKP